MFGLDLDVLAVVDTCEKIRCVKILFLHQHTD